MNVGHSLRELGWSNGRQREHPTQRPNGLSAVVALHRLGVRYGVKECRCGVQRVALGVVGIGCVVQALTIFVATNLL